MINISIFDPKNIALSKIHNKTVKGGTWTTEGFIRHKKHPRLGIIMPVKTLSPPPRNFRLLPTPLRDFSGKLMYALPGGYVYRQGERL